MSIGTATLLSISANVTLAIFGVALALLVLWQDPRRRSNQYFGLSMTAFALFGTFNTVWQVPQQFDLAPRPLLYIITTAYIAAIILFFNFMIAFAGLPRRIRQFEHVISLPLGTLLSALLWTDHLFVNFEPQAHGGYRYTITPAGIGGVLIAIAYLTTSISLVYRRHNPRARELTVPASILILGIAGFWGAPQMRAYSINAIAITVAIVLVGRVVVKHQVFQPLADLNDELAFKNAQLIEAARMKSQFLANMSHELRTPLNSIIGYTDLVVSRVYGDLSALQEDRLEKVVRNGHLLLELINDVLDLSKIEAGRLKLALARVPTAALLDEMAQTFEPKARESGLAFRCDYPPDLPALMVDELRTRQIMSNLLSNAIKFTPAGSITLSARTDAARNQIVLSVADTGIGIDSANQERVFEAFQQSSGTLTREYEGTGLGLTIARHLAQLHNGQLWFESETGKGSTFYVELPLASEPAHPAPMVTPGVQAAGPTILVIDDDYEAIEVIQGHLEASHFRVYGACSANDGIKLAHELRPAVITLDVRMPDTDGWQVIEALRRSPDTTAIPVLIITAADERERAHRYGANGFISKPVEPHILLEHINRLLVPAATHQEVES